MKCPKIFVKKAKDKLLRRKRVSEKDCDRALPPVGESPAGPETQVEEQQPASDCTEQQTEIRRLSNETLQAPHLPSQSRVSCWATSTKKFQDDRPDDYHMLLEIPFENGIQNLENPDILLQFVKPKTKDRKELSRTLEQTIRYILQFKDVAACLGEYTLSREVLGDLNTVTPNLSYWINVEKLYLGTVYDESNKFNQLEPRLVNLYSAILDLQVFLIGWVSANRAARVIQQSQKNVEWKDLIKNWSNCQKACQDSLAECKLKIDEHRKIKTWLSDYHPDDGHYNALKRTGVDQKYRTCGQWLLDTQAFKTWSSIDAAHGQSVLWLRGTTGTGKSTLFARIVQWHLDRASLYPHHRFAYFYCSRGTDLKSLHSYESVLRALLRQAAFNPVTGEISAPVLNAYHNAGGSSGDLRTLRLDDCKTLLHDILELEASLKLRIFVDALDECDQPRELLKTLRDASQDNPHALELFVSSRREVDVKDKLPQAVMIDLNELKTSGDMVRYINAEVLEREKDERILRGEREDLENKLIRILCGRAGGMFRWVQLQLSAFLNPRDPLVLSEAVEKSLNKLDTGSFANEEDLWAAYNEIFRRNVGKDDNQRLCASIVYKFVLCGLEPLSLAVVTTAVSFRMRDSSINDTAIYLLTRDFIVETAEGQLAFAHVSVKDFLQRTWPSEYATEDCHAESALLCLDYISTRREDEIKEDTSDIFLLYSSYMWGDHCLKAGKEKRRELGVSNKLEQWLVRRSGPMTHENLLPVLETRYGSTELRSNPYSPIFAICQWDLVETLEMLLSESGAVGLDLNLRSLENDTPLLIASRAGYIGIVEQLLLAKHIKHRPDVNLRDDRGRTALQWAVFAEAKGIIELLLKHGADVDHQDKYGGTALGDAVAQGCDDIAELLLSHGADVNLQDYHGRAILREAVMFRLEDIVELLLKHGANVDLQDDFGQSPLYIAVDSGRQIAALLLEHGANVDLQDQ
ncbi:hypothetical protein V2A60_009258 [Cordyceps javanica]